MDTRGNYNTSATSRAACSNGVINRRETSKIEITLRKLGFPDAGQYSRNFIPGLGSCLSKNRRQHCGKPQKFSAVQLKLIHAHLTCPIQ
jgi:hypothetical protein